MKSHATMISCVILHMKLLNNGFSLDTPFKFFLNAASCTLMKIYIFVIAESKNNLSLSYMIIMVVDIYIM